MHISPLHLVRSISAKRARYDGSARSEKSPIPKNRSIEKFKCMKRYHEDP